LDEVSLAAELELAMVWPRNFEGASFIDLVVLLLGGGVAWEQG